MAITLKKTEELRKMSRKDRNELLAKLLPELAHQKLRVRTNEDKQSHKIPAYERQISRIKTLNREEELKAKSQPITPEKDAK